MSCPMYDKPTSKLKSWEQELITYQEEHMRKRVVAIIEARMTSERLPGKVMLPLGGKPALEHVINRCFDARLVDQVVVASPVGSDSDPIKELCKRTWTTFHQGSEHDVLSRVADAASEWKADIIVSVTGDCPLTDTATIDYMLEAAIAANDVLGAECNQFFTNMCQESEPWPLGFAVQIFNRDMLKRADHVAHEQKYREHSGLWMSENCERVEFRCPIEAQDLPRLTLDYEEDYQLLQKVFEKDPQDLLDLNYIFACHPEWREINAHCVQKVPV